jgi:small-conductance mechanosensitive channel
MQHFFDFFNYQISLGSSVSFSLKSILIILVVFVLTKYFLRLIKKLVFRTLNKQAQYTFKSIFSFFNYFIYLIVILITFENIGVNVTGIFAASAALLVGVGLALQTFIQDIISGVFIIADQTVHVGDIIQLDGQVGKIENITLRTTRAVTIDNKVLIIPNHKFLTSVLYNWTENGTLTRENIHIGVAYGSDLNIVKQLLIDLSLEFNEVVREPKPDVLFNDFGDSALDLKLTFTINNSFSSNMVKSAIRYRIYEVFNENNIEIPFPQRTVWMNKS